jgi:hypothetical protein
MNRWQGPRLWIGLALVAASAAAATLWLHGTQLSSSRSVLPTPTHPSISPLATPVPEPTAVASSVWASGSPAFIWVALGVVLALALSLFVLHRHGRDAA